MIVTIKNLQQQTFTIDFDAEKTVSELKEAIFTSRGGEYCVEKQKLIYAGVILEDDRTLASYNVCEKKFIVVMLKRDFGTSSEKNIEASASKTGGTQAADKTTKENFGNSTNDDEASACNASIPEADLGDVVSNVILQNQAESNLLMGEEYNRSVDSMIEMGYTREMVERAMAASYNNPERAVEYLISGIPEVVDDGFETEHPEQRTSDSTQRSDQRESENRNSRNDSSDPFEFLRDQPQFLQMRSLVYQNPELLHAVLQQIGQTNPALLQLISENQDAFLNMLNQPIEGQVGNNSQRHPQLNAATLASATGINMELTRESRLSGNSNNMNRVRAGTTSTPIGAEDALPSESNLARGTNDNEGPAVIRLTRAEQDAVERLKAMGFPEALVLQAYFACDKDEQLTANFLISSTFED